MTTRVSHRIGLGLVGAGLLALASGALPAGAHVTGDKGEVPAGAYTQVTFTVPHGCEDEPTTAIAVQIPEAILNAAPQVVAGWDVETTITALDEPVETAHGEDQTERVSEITWTAQPGNELPSPFRQVFTVGFKAPDTPGEDLVFPIVQACPTAETAWIEVPADGEEEPEHPAVVVAVGEAEGDGHGGDTEETEDGDAEETAATEASSADDPDDGGSDGLAVAGVVMGGLGLAAGGAALVKGRAAR
jgi:uncharacterized protein YcnI